MKTVAFCTLGCKVNQYETNAMMQKMIEAGYKVVDFETKADIYIINTCTVTNMADKKSRQMLRSHFSCCWLLCSSGKRKARANTRD